MSHSENSLAKGHPMTIFFVAVVFLVFIAWMASAASPGGASHFHTVKCDSSNPGPGFPSCPGNDTNTAYWDINGGTTDNFSNFYNQFTLIFGGILVMVALLAGFVVWIFRKHE